jgi:type II restriction enzyme
MAPILRKKVGNMMEYYIADNLECPECHVRKLKVIGNHTPSLDIICSHCNNNFEVKSKCLSVNNLPNDIKLPHGSYFDYVNRLNKGLNLIVIIYGVDRIKKLITIREVLYANNNLLKNVNIVKVSKRIDNNLSTIMIKNKETLNKLKILTNNTVLTFKNDVDKFTNIIKKN